MSELYQNFLFDTHTHLHDPRFDEDRMQVLESCSEQLAGWINVGSDLATSQKSIEYATNYSKSFASAGIHPHDAATHSMDELDDIQKLLSNEKVKAAGEMGLDYYYDNSPREIQKEIFKRQLEFAKESQLPCIIHVRDAFEDFFKVVDEVNYHHGVVHCFSGDVEQLEAIVDRGFYAGYGGVMTFKNAQITRDSFLKTPLDRILLETDCPYLSPVPKRGKRNTPLYVSYVAEFGAEIRDISVEQLVRKSYENAKELFELT